VSITKRSQYHQKQKQKENILPYLSPLWDFATLHPPAANLVPVLETLTPYLLVLTVICTDNNIIKTCKIDDCWQDGIKGSNKVGKWKSCHQEREIGHLGVTMAKPLWSHALGTGSKK
jgi:hypothetical protein